MNKNDRSEELFSKLDLILEGYTFREISVAFSNVISGMLHDERSAYPPRERFCTFVSILENIIKQEGSNGK